MQLAHISCIYKEQRTYFGICPSPSSTGAPAPAVPADAAVSAAVGSEAPPVAVAALLVTLVTASAMICT